MYNKSHIEDSRADCSRAKKPWSHLIGECLVAYVAYVADKQA